MSECLECGAPNEIIDGHEMPGSDFDGGDALFWADIWLCAAGHKYHLIDEARTVKL